jgi:predicted enzyme related to lactoylglutathione lyase
MTDDFMDREELEALQAAVEAEHGHTLDYGVRRHFFGVVPVFLAEDIAKTCEYYEKVLGFSIGFTYGDPPSFASVYRNNAVIHLNRGAAGEGRRGGGPDGYVIVNDVDELHEEMSRHGATIVSEPVTAEYGMREFVVEDCNGYRLTLAEGIFREDVMNR